MPSPEQRFFDVASRRQVGDTLAGRLRVEIEQESNARLTSSEYPFVVENRFRAGDKRIHALAHYLLATIDREHVESLQPQRVHSRERGVGGRSRGNAVLVDVPAGTSHYRTGARSAARPTGRARSS